MTGPPKGSPARSAPQARRSPAQRLARARLYLCSPDRPDLEDFIAACISGGVDVVQLRDKQLEARQLLARARRAASTCSALGVPFVLNDRPDLAADCGADGVHLGQDDAPVSLARRLLGPDVLIGLSTHSSAELAAALEEPVDYLSVGPVVATPTKPGRPGTGVDYVAQAHGLLDGAPGAGATMPFFVTGGVTPETVPGLVAAGARRFVVVRYLCAAADPASAARRLADAIDQATGPGN